MRGYNWKFYSKLFKYILEKYFDPVVKNKRNYIKYKIIVNDKIKNYQYYPGSNYWSDFYTRYLTFKKLKYYCINFANIIGYE
jgi:hypothetical protein